MMKILLVDDSESIRNALAGMLSDLGGEHAVHHASSTEETIEYLREETPDAVILDIRLPDGSGMDVLRYIRDKRLPSKVIMLTNYPYPQYKKRCLDMGADFFFDKSTEFERVLEVLRSFDPPPTDR